MVSTQDFLTDVLPDEEPFYFVVTPYVSRDGLRKGLRHTALMSPEAVASYAEGRDVDVWFAFGGYEHSFVRQTDRKGKTKKRWRVQENVTNINCFVLDIDVDPEKERLASSKKEAMACLKTFLKETKFFKPSYIVDSGGGYHVYWCFEQSVPRDVWRTAAFKLKRLLAAHGGPVSGDLVRVSDPSGVLRVPGTANYKKEKPRTVRIVYPRDGEDRRFYKFKKMEAWLTKHAPVGDDSERRYKSGLALPSAPDGLRAIMRRFPGHVALDNFEGEFDAMRAGCALVDKHCELGGDVPEPFWYGFLGTLVAMPEERADELALEHSSGHGEFDEDTTLNKMEQVRDAQADNPITCARFEERAIDSGIESPCSTCVFRRKVNTPFRITREMVREAGTKDQAEQLDEPEEDDEAAPADKGSISGYSLTPDGLYAFFPKEEEPGFYKVSFTPMVIDKAVIDNETGEVIGYNMHVDRPDKEVNILIPPSAFARKDSLVTHMIMAGVRFTDRDTDGLRCATFLKRSRSRVDAGEMTRSIKRFGWHGKKFAIGRTVIAQSGETTETVVEASIEAFAKKFDTAGDIRDWSVQVDRYLSHGLCKNYTLVAAVAAGAPVMKMLNIPGVLVNLVGASGHGKSLALRIAHSIWGLPLERVTGPTDTINYVMKGVAAYYNLPITFDEITNIESADLSNFCYALTQGTERGSLTSERKARTPLSGWHTAVLSSSNASMLARLSEGKLDPEAEQMRVLELASPKAVMNGSLTYITDALLENYGVAGHRLAAMYSEDYDKIRGVAKQLFETMLAEAGGKQRFRVAALVSASVGAQMLYKLGLEKSMARNRIKELIKGASDEGLVEVSVEDSGAYALLKALHAYCSANMSVYKQGVNIDDGSDKPMARVDYKKSGKVILSVRMDVFAQFCRQRNVRVAQARSAMKSEKLYAGNGLEAIGSMHVTRTAVEKFNYHIIDAEMYSPNKMGQRRAS